MARSNSNNNNTVVLFTPIADAAYGLALQGMKQITSRRTGATNYVLVFEGAEVVMPGNWQIRSVEFPKGLYVGQVLNAYWEKDANGDDRFHLEEVR